MKHILFATITVITTIFFLSACNDDITDMGSSIQPSSDIIDLQHSVFKLSSATKEFESVYARQDSFLLGKFYDRTFGTTSADILAQVMCPIGFKFPEGWVPDSARIEFTYQSWTGDENSVLRINAYEMDGDSTLKYNTEYPSNIDVSKFCRFNTPLASAVVKAKDSLRSSSTAFTMKLSDEFVQRFKPTDNSTYESKSSFLKFFKGLYFQTDFGSSVMLNIYGINLRYYYHYTSIGTDGTARVVNLNLSFPVNSEVKQINKIVVDRSNVSIPSTYTYVASPANYYTTVALPLKQIKDELATKINGKKLVVNTAIMKVEAANVNVSSYLGIPNYMLALKESEIKSFFSEKDIPSANDTLASYATYGYTIKDNDTTFSYSFELSKMLANEIRQSEKNSTTLPDTMKLVLVPVTILTTTSSSTTVVSGAANLMKLSGVMLKNQNSDVPIRLNVTYSGY